MGRAKTPATARELFAVMTSAGHKEVRKVYQYYSVFSFCRDCGETKEVAQEIGRWVRDKAQAGDSYHGANYGIEIVEREVPA